ncbi:hemolysin [Brasilonema sp. UFV-L1]|uniref:beta strand repeat-containing protein n=1 Tax=Brasilonema sp. UFV-L1 TaxID=2234130 RepID=UPI00145E47A4|nr:hemolysin [Brasilonema sp. UFV-L1]NMG06777.1 hemolysin [Brasilonema sp. UFV-L1]
MGTITVTSNADNGAGSLREAIAQAQSGDTIQFDSSLANQTITLTSGQLTVDETLTIDGSGANGLTISGNNASRIFDVVPGSNFSLQNLTLANGKASGTGEDGSGGAIRTISSDQLTTLNVENSRFIDNSSSGLGGGAIWSGFKTANTVTNSVFEGNDSTAGKNERGGGAIAVNTNSTLTVKSSEFNNNKGTNGGAINTVLSTLTVEDSTFRNNDSTAGGPIGPHTIGYGGAIYTDGANASGPNYDYGPVGGTITIRDSYFEGNKAAGQGGGLLLYAYPPDKIIVENSTITNNEVVEDSQGDSLGGGLRIGNADFTVNNTTITDNRALDQGGGLWVGEQSSGTISNSTFTGNRAESADGKDGLGGAITLANGSNPVTIEGTTVANNYAGWQGGGISGGGSSTTVTNSTFADNVAYNGGNNWNIKNQVTNQLSDGGGNTQWPAKNANDPTDLNVTESINIAQRDLSNLQNTASGNDSSVGTTSNTIAPSVTDNTLSDGSSNIGQPDSSNLQNTAQSAGNSVTGDDSSVGTTSNTIAPSVTDNTLSDGSSVDSTGNNTYVDSISNTTAVDPTGNSVNNSLTPVVFGENSSNDGSDTSLTQVPTSNDGSYSSNPAVTIGSDSLLCGNITANDNLYNGLSQDTLTQSEGINNSTLTPGQGSELSSNLNSGQDYVSLLDTISPSQLSFSQPGQDSWNKDNTQLQSPTSLESANTSTLTGNPQYLPGQNYSSSVV